MVYGYCRVSTKGQLDGNSIDEQSDKIKKRYPDAVLIIETYSAAKERKKFIELIKILKKEDILVVSKLDRFCRTTKEGLQHIDDLMNKGVTIHILNMGLIEDTSMGRMIVTNLLAFAEFERSMIIERTQEGKERAKQKQGYSEGRPPVYSREQKLHALELLETNTYKRVEELTGISKRTLIRAKKRFYE